VDVRQEGERYPVASVDIRHKIKNNQQAETPTNCRQKGEEGGGEKRRILERGSWVQGFMSLPISLFLSVYGYGFYDFYISASRQRIPIFFNTSKHCTLDAILKEKLG
jgi:hypothetical protein